MCACVVGGGQEGEKPICFGHAFDVTMQENTLAEARVR